MIHFSIHQFTETSFAVLVMTPNASEKGNIKTTQMIIIAVDLPPMRKSHYVHNINNIVLALHLKVLQLRLEVGLGLEFRLSEPFEMAPSSFHVDTSSTMQNSKNISKIPTKMHQILDIQIMGCISPAVTFELS